MPSRIEKWLIFLKIIFLSPWGTVNFPPVTQCMLPVCRIHRGRPPTLAVMSWMYDVKSSPKINTRTRKNSEMHFCETSPFTKMIFFFNMHTNIYDLALSLKTQRSPKTLTHKCLAVQKHLEIWKFVQKFPKTQTLKTANSVPDKCIYYLSCDKTNTGCLRCYCYR